MRVNRTYECMPGARPPWVFADRRSATQLHDAANARLRERRAAELEQPGRPQRGMPSSLYGYVALPAFQERAACADQDPGLFHYPYRLPEGERGGRARLREREVQAKAVCVGCPVIAECLAFAVENDEYGIWGGLTRRARLELVRLLRGAEELCPGCGGGERPPGLVFCGPCEADRVSVLRDRVNLAQARAALRAGA